MKTPLKSLLYSFQIFIGVILTWQGMTEAYKFAEANGLQATFSLTMGFLMIYLGVMNVSSDGGK